MARDNSSQTNTIIGPNTSLVGNLDVKGSIIIYGSVEGDIKAAGQVRTAKDSSIRGDVTSAEAIIDGILEGSLTTAGRATLGGSSKVVGEILVDLLVIEEGAQFTGHCEMKEGKIVVPAKEQTDPEAAAAE